MEVELLAPPEKMVKDILRINVNANWGIREFGEFVSAIEDLYRFILLIEDTNLIDNTNSLLLTKKVSNKNVIKLRIYENSFSINHLEHIYSITDFFPENLRPKLIKVKYNSPGSIDILGIGKIVETIKDLIIEIIDKRADLKIKDAELQLKKIEAEDKKTEVELKKAELKIKKIELDRLKIENAENIVRLANEMNLKGDQYQKAMRFVLEKESLFDKVIEQDKISSIETISEEEI